MLCPEQASGEGYDLSLERIYDTRIGSFLPAEPERLFRPGHLPATPVICLGEHHDSILDHRLQFRSIAALHRAAPDEPLAIGLEMFYKTQTPALHRYVFEHGSLDRLVAETEWKKTWGYAFAPYAKIFRYARVHRLPLVGLNVPRAVVSLVRARGLADLPPELRKVLPEMDLDNPTHYSRFKEVCTPCTADTTRACGMTATVSLPAAQHIQYNFPGLKSFCVQAMIDVLHC